MLRINRSLNVEQDNLNECIDILEKDLDFALTDFQQLIQSLKNGERVASVKQKLGKANAQETEENQRKLNESIQKLEKLEKNLLDSSVNLGKMRSGTLQNPSLNSARNDHNEEVKNDAATTNKVKEEAEKVKKMQQELDSRKKLNKILIKEIEKLKDADQQAPQSDSNKKARNLDNTLQIKATVNERVQNRLNMSQLDTNQQKDNYLMLKEQDLVLEKESNAPAQEPAGFFQPQTGNLEQSSITNPTMHQKNIKEIDEIKGRIDGIKKRLEVHESVFKQARNCIYKLQNGETLIDLLPEFDQQIVADFTQKSLAEITISELATYLEQVKEQIQFFDGELDQQAESPKKAQFDSFSKPSVAAITPQTQAQLKRLQEEVQNQSQTIQNLVDKIEDSKNRQQHLLSNLPSVHESAQTKNAKIEDLKSEVQILREKLAAAKSKKLNPLTETKASEEGNLKIQHNLDLEKVNEGQCPEVDEIAGEEEAAENFGTITQVDLLASKDQVPNLDLNTQQVNDQLSAVDSHSEEGEKSSDKSIKTEKKVSTPSMGDKKPSEPLMIQSISPEKREIDGRSRAGANHQTNKIAEDYVDSIEEEANEQNQAETSIQEINQDENRDSRIFTPRGTNVKQIIVSSTQIQQAQKELDEYLHLADNIESLPLTSPQIAEQKRPTVSQLLNEKKEDHQSKAESVAMDEINDLINF